MTDKTDLDLAAVTDKLRWLKMPGMARGLDAIVERAASHNLTPLEIADALAEAEKQSRIQSAIERRVRGARFAEINTVDGFDFGFDPVRRKLRARYLALCDLAFLDLVPRAWRRNRSTWFRAHGVCGGKRRAVTVAPGVDVDAPLAIDLVELLRQMFGRVRHEQFADGVGESRDFVHVRLAIERHDDVKALAAGGLDPRWQPQLLEQIAQADRGATHRSGVIG